MKGNCKLCLKDKELIRRSHLFPDFMYNGISDNKNRIFGISSSKPFHKKTFQSGAYEKYILCSDCDNHVLGKLERYANNHFYLQPYRKAHKNFVHGISEGGIKSIHCKNIDYSQFKLFLQSLLWRASISEHKLFKNFRLTVEKEEQLRNSIYNNSPLQEDDYPSLISTHQNDEVLQTDMVFINASHPKKVTFFINHFTYLFYLDKTIIDEFVRDMALSKKNEIGIILLPHGKWTELRTSIIHSIAELASRN